MPTPKGYLEWGYRFARGPVYLEGALLTEAGTAWPVSWTTQAAGNILQLAGGSSIVQLQWTAENLPMSRRAIPASVQFTASDEDAYSSLLRASQLGAPVRLFLGLWVCDTWLITAAAASRTLWRTSRRLPYGLGLITRGGPEPNWEPRAWLDGTEQTVVASGTPTTGQVMVPNGSTYYAEVETPAAEDLGATYLHVQYPAELWCRITMAHQVQVANVLGLQLTLEEVLP